MAGRGCGCGGRGVALGLSGRFLGGAGLAAGSVGGRGGFGALLGISRFCGGRILKGLLFSLALTSTLGRKRLSNFYFLSARIPSFPSKIYALSLISTKKDYRIQDPTSQ